MRFSTKRDSTASRRSTTSTQPAAGGPSESSAVKMEEEMKERSTSHRLMGWAALCLFSIVALASQVSATRDTPRGKDDWFIIVVSITSVGSSFFSLLGYALARQAFPGSVFEGFFAVLCQIFWICGMPVIMDPDRNIAVSKGISAAANGNLDVVFVGGSVSSSNAVVAHEFTYIRNANIYFFSWASTISIVYILGKFVLQVAMERRRRRSMSTRKRPSLTDNLGPKTSLWYLLTLASLVVMVDSIELFMAFSCPGNNPDLCMRTKYAVSLGTIGTWLSFGSSLLATLGKLGAWLEFFASFCIFGLYMAGVGLITFNDGPGTSLGNLYFATWMGASVTAILMARTYQDLVLKIRSPPPQDLPDDVPTPEAPVVFPDVEMGGTPKDEGIEVEVEDENNPSWVKVDPKPPTKYSTRKAVEAEDVEVEWASSPTEKGMKEKEVVVGPDDDDIVVPAVKATQSRTMEPARSQAGGDEISDNEKLNSQKRPSKVSSSEKVDSAVSKSTTEKANKPSEEESENNKSTNPFEAKPDISEDDNAGTSKPLPKNTETSSGGVKSEEKSPTEIDETEEVSPTTNPFNEVEEDEKIEIVSAKAAPKAGLKKRTSSKKGSITKKRSSVKKAQQEESSKPSMEEDSKEKKGTTSVVNEPATSDQDVQTLPNVEEKKDEVEAS